MPMTGLRSDVPTSFDMTLGWLDMISLLYRKYAMTKDRDSRAENIS